MDCGVILIMQKAAASNAHVRQTRPPHAMRSLAAAPTHVPSSKKSRKKGLAATGVALFSSTSNCSRLSHCLLCPGRWWFLSVVSLCAPTYACCIRSTTTYFKSLSAVPVLPLPSFLPPFHQRGTHQRPQRSMI